MTPSVSVIIPVYNAEAYVAKTADRILRQSIQKIEILLVDDGSTDDSLRICRDLVSNDSRIIVVHQENAGVSAARNTGLDNANGEYIAFIDSDDLVALDYLEYLVSNMSDDTVLSMCAHARIRDYDHQFPVTHEIFGRIPAQQCARRLLSGNFPVCVCGGLFKKDLIGDLRFPVGIRNNEDKLFLYEYLLRNENGTVAFSNEKLYGYMVREGSATRSSWNGSLDIVTVADRIREVTDSVHPEWSTLTHNVFVGARLDVMKSILRADYEEKDHRVYEALRQEVVSSGFPATGNRRLKLEYVAAMAGKPVYRALIQLYYSIYTDRKRFRLNEKMTYQNGR